MNEIPQPPPTRLALWLVRLLLAALLAFGSEVLLWTNPLGRNLLEIPLLLVGYLLLAVILMDWLVRYNIRDLLGLMTLAGLYGLLNALLLNPDTTLFDIPRTLVTRVTGAHTLLGLEMIFAFMALTGGRVRYLRRVMLIGAGVVGIAWGTWVRWSPVYADVAFGMVSLETMLMVGAVCMAILAILVWLLYRYGINLTPQSLLLTNREWGVAVLGVLVLLLIRWLQLYLQPISLAVAGVLLALSFAMIWFRKNTKLIPIAAHHFPIRPQRWLIIGLSVAILVWMGLFTYGLPLIGTDAFNQLTVVVYGFTLYGLAWLPTVSLWLGVRAYIRQIQAKPL